MACIVSEGSEETGANGHEYGAGDHERCVIAEATCAGPGEYAANNKREDSGDVHDTRMYGTCVLDGLELDG